MASRRKEAKPPEPEPAPATPLPKPPAMDQCEKCGFRFRVDEWQEFESYDAEEGRLAGADQVKLFAYRCDRCNSPIVKAIRWQSNSSTQDLLMQIAERRFVLEPGPDLSDVLRRPLPDGVPKELAKDFNEARSVIDKSPTAAAALARRCLQHFCAEYLGAKARDLADSIDQVVKSGRLSHLNVAFDAIRILGNFASHPTKNAAGVLVDVEPGETEATLEVLWEAFDAEFGAPLRAQAIRDRINQKLTDAGRKPLN